MADYEYEINGDNIEDVLGLPPPRREHHEYGVIRSGGDGKTYGDGFPWCLWNFDFLTTAMLDTLLSYITGQSTVVSIKTRLNDGSYQAYTSTVMHRPQVPDDAVGVFGGWANVKIKFTRLEV